MGERASGTFSLKYITSKQPFIGRPLYACNADAACSDRNDSSAGLAGDDFNIHLK